jgi:hypothetical protein
VSLDTRGPHTGSAVIVYSPETWVTDESRDMGNSVMIFVGTKEVPHALEANVAHGPEDSISR